MIAHRSTLSAAEAAAVRRLAAGSPGAADSPPLSEDALLRLGEPGRHLLVLEQQQVLGYARLSEDGAGAEAELVASSPAVAEQLITELVTGRPGLRLWSHGPQALAGPAAIARGLKPARTLLQLRAPLTGLDVLHPAAGIEIHPFRPGVDDEAWLAVNARAFAHHPEQGRWRQHELDQRLSAPWFEPAGFFLAWQGSRLVGYHWTKLHEQGPAQPPLGEVYVLGVDPDAQGLRLGTALLNIGLRHLFDRGARTALLYVEADNQTAVHLYEKAGFSEFSRDVQFSAE